MDLDDFDCGKNVRPASVGQKLTILEDRPLGPHAQYLGSLKHSLIINDDAV